MEGEEEEGEEEMWEALRVNVPGEGLGEAGSSEGQQKAPFVGGTLREVALHAVVKATSSRECELGVVYGFRGYATPAQLLQTVLELEAPGRLQSVVREGRKHLLKTWIEAAFNYDLQGDSEVIERLLRWVEETLAPQEQTRWKLLLLRHARPPSAREHIVRTASTPRSEALWDMSLDLFSEFAGDIARELTNVDYACYREIEASELLGIAWQKDEGRNAPHLVDMRDRFNQLSFWCASAVLSARDEEDLELAHESLVSIAWELRLMQNFNSMAAVMSALQSIDVERLHMVERLKKPFSAQHAEMEELLSMKKNFHNYRDALARSERCIPYIPLHLRDLLSLHEREGDYLDEEHTRLNWTKMKAMGVAVDLVLHHQSPAEAWPTATNLELRERLLQAPFFSEADREAKSDEWKKRLEAPEGKKKAKKRTSRLQRWRNRKQQV